MLSNVLRAHSARLMGSKLSAKTHSHIISHRIAHFSTAQATRQQVTGPLARVRTAAKYTGIFCLSSVFGILAIGTGIFVHDAFTYNEKHIDRVPVSPLALHPKSGGPKNLPIARVYVGDEEDEENRKLAEKPRLVIVGGGWGAMGVLQTLHPGDYHVTVVSSETFTTFTPLLPSAAVGTVQVRSLIEPIRKIIARLHGHFIQGKAIDLVMNERLLEVETASSDGKRTYVYIPYDKLVIAVGSTSSTHGIKGLEHCFQLKTIADAQAIRRRIMDNFEIASLPTTSPEERRRLLSFVICGGGPTGVETAAEIYDFCQEDIFNYFPKICREEVSIHVIQSRSHILNTYSEAISEYAEKKFKREEVDLITSARVDSVTSAEVIYTTKGPDGKTVKHHIPTNFVLWSTGIAMNPFTQRVSSLLPNQVNKKAIEIDAYLRVNGAPLGEVYAVGDCATFETSLVNHFMELVKEADRDGDGKINFGEWENMGKRLFNHNLSELTLLPVKKIKQRIPLAEDHLLKVKEIFELYDTDADNSLSLNELAKLMEEIGSKITALPATAQVAAQEGKYLGKNLHKIARASFVTTGQPEPITTGRRTGTTSAKFVPDESVSKPFKYFHLGSLAYIGNAAVFDFGKISLTGGLMAMYAWRSVYWNEQCSTRTRALLMIDWIIRGIWGRDLSRL